MAMKIKKEELGKARMRKGMATFDLVLYIGLAALALGLIIWMWTGLKVKMETNNFRDKAMTVIAGVDKAKNDYNTGAYVVSGTTAIPNIQKLRMAMGGTKAVKSLSGWTYACANGNASTITLVSETNRNTDVLDGAVLSLADKFSDWTIARSGSTIRMTRTNSVCK